MSFELLYIFLKIHTLTCIVAFITLLLVLEIISRLFHNRHKEKLYSLGLYIDIIPFVAGIIPVTVLIPLIHSISQALAPNAHSSDIKVVAAGFQEVFTSLTVCCGLFFLFLAAWLIVRMIYNRFLGELETLSKE
jgi:hypothetical protein